MLFLIKESDGRFVFISVYLFFEPTENKDFTTTTS